MRAIKEETSSSSPTGQTPYLTDPSKQHLSYIQSARESICVSGHPLNSCPRCRDEGLSPTPWKPHRHIGEMKIRYICERNFQELESTHHYDIPLCPLCSCVLYLYEFNALIGATNARKLHKYALKCTNKHVLPLLDIFCQTRKGNGRCNANLKLQWCYGTMVARCESQKNRDHDLWWVRYKNEWKQRRTMIRYKKDFLSHLSDSQRGLLLSLGLEGDPPPDPKGALGPSFETLLTLANNSPSGSTAGGSGPGSTGSTDDLWRKRSFSQNDRIALTRKKRLKHFGMAADSNGGVATPSGCLDSAMMAESSSGSAETKCGIDINDLVTGTPWDENDSVDAKKVVGQIVCFPLLPPPPG